MSTLKSENIGINLMFGIPKTPLRVTRTKGFSARKLYKTYWRNKKALRVCPQKVKTCKSDDKNISSKNSQKKLIYVDEIGNNNLQRRVPLAVFGDLIYRKRNGLSDISFLELAEEWAPC